MGITTINLFENNTGDIEKESRDLKVYDYRKYGGKISFLGRKLFLNIYFFF